MYELDQSLAEKFVKTLDNRSQLKGIEATKQALDERAQKRAAEWEAIRLENATNIKGRAGIAAADLKKGLHKSAYVAGNVLDGLGKGFHALSSAFDSLISPKLSPEQIRQGELSRLDREAEAEHSIDFPDGPPTAPRSVRTTRSSKRPATGNGRTSENADYDFAFSSKTLVRSATRAHALPP